MRRKLVEAKANAADLVFSTATFHWVKDHQALFAGIFIVRYHLELLLFVPQAAVARARSGVTTVLLSQFSTGAPTK